MHAASKRQYTAAGGEVQVIWGGFTSDGRWNRPTDTRIGKASAVLRELYPSVVTKRFKKLFQTPQSCRLNRSLFRSSPILTYDHESWVLTERMLSEVKGQRWDFFEEFTVCHFVPKCAAVKFTNPDCRVTLLL